MATRTTDETDWYRLDPGDAMSSLDTTERGLSAAEADIRREHYGSNELEERGGRTRRQIFISQFRDLFTVILIAAAVISLVLGDFVETVVILAIVVLNALMGYVQESKAEQAMAALQRMAVPEVRVIRGGEPISRPAPDLVPGDVVVLETGNIVPADGRLFSSSNLEIDESALTGESEPVSKDAQVVYETTRAMADRRNLVHMGTTVTRGRAHLLVTRTGMRTELGRIAEMIQSVDEDRTPLQRRLDHLAKVIAVAALVVVVLVFVIGMLQGESIETMLLTSVSLAVAAIPEAMPAVVTIALSLGAQRMLKEQALIRRLPAVETLGSVAIICTDKTGTLTENRMTVTVVDVADHRIDLAGTAGGGLEAIPVEDDEVAPTLQLALAAGALCNDAMLSAGRGGVHKVVGDPTEGALVVAAAEFGLLKPALERALPRVAEVPFDSVRKRMTTIHRVPLIADAPPEALGALWETPGPVDRSPYIGFTKGAIEGILDLAGWMWVADGIQPINDEWRRRALTAADQLADRGMRVLAVAVRGWDVVPDTDGAAAESDLVLVGLFGLMDPPRPAVAEAVRRCRAAGIRPVMITGDHPLTARHIAQQVGIAETDDFLTGDDLDRLDDDRLLDAIDSTSVFARVAPEHKLRLISAYQRSGDPAAMTGDGVNDAPALKQADIGVAMGITGTDVAKEASDMVLLDDNFATIVAAVEGGRVIYDNIRKFIKYLLTCNASELTVMIVGPLLGMPLPLLPLQILWMNLVTDGLPALALGVEPAEDDVMERAPRSASETIFGGGVVPYIIGMGALMATVSLATGFGMWQADNAAWQTVLFTTLIVAQLALALEVRSERRSLLSLGLMSNRPMLGAVAIGLGAHLALVYVPFLQRVFSTVPLSAAEMAVAFSGALVIFVGAEMQKWIGRLRSAATVPTGSG